MSESGQIYELLAKARRKIGAVGKTGKNQKQGYQFRGIDDIYNAFSAALDEFGLLTVPMFDEHRLQTWDRHKGGQVVGIWVHVIVRGKYRIIAPDGSSVEMSTYGEGMDTGDKATNCAMSAAHKYALIQLMCLPTDEPIDIENRSPEPTRQQAPIGKTKADNLRQLCADVGADPTRFIQWCRDEFGTTELEKLTDDQFNAALGTLERKRNAG